MNLHFKLHNIACTRNQINNYCLMHALKSLLFNKCRDIINITFYGMDYFARHGLTF